MRRRRAPAAPVETPPRPTKRKADAAAEKLARSVKAKVAEPVPEKGPEKEPRSAKAKTEEPQSTTSGSAVSPSHASQAEAARAIP